MIRTFLPRLAALGAALTPAFAQTTGEDPADLITVEATRQRAKPLTEAVSPITVITEDDLKRQASTFLLDALARTPGLTIDQSGGLGGAASVRIRGAGSDQTLVLVDGIPVGDTAAPGGGFDFARFDVSSIARVEVLRGPQSVRWGSEAIGGVINIVTREPDGSGLSGFAEGGSFGTVRGGLALDGARGGQQGRLAVTGISSDGFSKADENAGNDEADGFESFALSTSSRHDFGRAVLSAGILYQGAETEFDSFDFLAPGFVADGDEVTDSEELFAHINLDVDLSEGWSGRVLVGHSSIDRTNFSGGERSFAAQGHRTTLRTEAFGSFLESVDVTVGADADFRETDDRISSIAGIFALGEWGLGSFRKTFVHDLVLSAGVRVDHHDSAGTEVTGHAGFSKALSDHWRLRASWGQGFKAPSLFQETFICCGAAEANPDLAPERSNGVDGGVAFFGEDRRLEVTAFYLKTEDQIDFVLGRYENIAEVETKGVEVAAVARLSPWLTGDVSYTYTEAEDGSGNDLPRIPAHTADLVLTAAPKSPFSGSLLLRFNGEEEDSFGTVDSWLRLDATAAYEISDRAELYLRAENVTDTEYQQVFGYGTPDASVTIGLRARTR